MLEVKPLTKGKRASSLYEWYADNKEGRLDLMPSYGRNSAPWPEKKQALLINSVLNGWDLPKFYLANFTYGTIELMEQRRPYAVIDGLQRFEALFGFMRGARFALALRSQTDRGGRRGAAALPCAGTPGGVVLAWSRNGRRATTGDGEKETAFGIPCASC